MPTTTLNATFDGTNPVTTLNGTIDWNSSNRIDVYSQFEDDPADMLEANVSFDGTGGWRVRFMQFGDEAETSQLNLTDANSATGRRIDILNLGYNSDVTLLSTRVDFINGWDGALHDVTLGSEDVRFIGLEATTNILTTGGSNIGAIETGGSSTITVNDGFVASINANNNADTLIVDNGADVRSASLRGGDDTVTVQNGSRLDYLNISGGTNTITVSDTSRIGALELNDGTQTVTLNGSAQFRQMNLNNSNLNLTTDSGSARSLYAYEGSHTLNIGSGGIEQIRFTTDTLESHTIVANGYVGALRTSDRSSTATDDQTVDLTLNAGADAILLGSGNDTVNANGDYVDRINTSRGNDMLGLASADVGSIQLGDGNDTATLSGTTFVSTLDDRSGDTTITLSDSARIGLARLDGGTNTLNLQDTARIFHVKMDRGDNTLNTASGNIESVYSFNSSNTFNIGSGGVQQMTFSADMNVSHTVVSDGFINSFNATDSSSTTDDDQTTNLTLNTFAGAIRLGGGNDMVTTGSGYVDLINTAAGNDTVIVGSGGARMVALRDGNDTVFLNELTNAEDGVSMQGSSGNDTIDFSLITTTGVTFSLNSGGAWQETEAGWFQESGSMENLTGTNRGDVLTGDDGVNRIKGFAGRDEIYGGGDGDRLFGEGGDDTMQGDAGEDRLFGGAGNDVLNGGADRDLLVGGDGADVFVFGENGDRDKVRDFEDGIDILRIENHTGGFGTLTINTAFGPHLLIGYDGGEIMLRGLAGTTLTEADFDFVIV